MITGHTFGGVAQTQKHGKVFGVRARNDNGGFFFFGTYPDRIKASVVAALVNEMKEKGETVEAIKKRVYFEHGNKKKTLITRVSKHIKESLKSKYARELQWVAEYTFLRSV
jgi:hypothetical protein